MVETMSMANINTKTQKKFDIFDKTYIFSLFFFANIHVSPLLSLSIGGIKLWMPIFAIVFLILLMPLCVKKLSSIHIKEQVIYILLFFILCQLAYGMYYQSINAIGYNSGLLLGIFLVILFKDIDDLDNSYMDIFIKWSTVFMFILIVGAYAGFFYHRQGGRAILSFNNPDGRGNGLYLTTLSNTAVFGYLRPAGIYDEPGTFSFFICSISLLRILFRKKNSITSLLLISGIITFSLTHFLVMICYFLHLAINHYRKKTFFWVFLLTILCIVVIYVIFKNVFDSMILRRISITGILNNNRTRQIPNVINNLDIRTFLFGLVADYDYDFLKMTEYIGGDVSSNPLTPLIATGVIASLIYYLFLCIVFFSSFLEKRLFFIYFAIFILFLQRPYFTSRGYCIYFIMFFLLSMHCISHSIPHIIFKFKGKI
jgi:hypothetical protein